ncbi:class I SAM-dependent methyltransferase [Kribbella sp. NBC_01484]|uniref:class I SAM-dependent methyltransferase n=1 Tax=Kribbella sp. NBC_01484 TaxID=2903579 RepID=UPI002E30036A|nr:class I SAM-dependent methyltransferase [Kribbella sp. NBC_01484]
MNRSPWVDASPQSIPSTLRPSAWLQEILEVSRVGLDLGCGSRSVWDITSAPGSRKLYLLDVNKAAMVSNPSLWGARVCGDIRQLPFGDGTFDTVTANAVLTALSKRSEYVAAFAELNRIVMADGHLYVGDFLYEPTNSAYRLRYLQEERGSFYSESQHPGDISYFAKHWTLEELDSMLDSFDRKKFGTRQAKSRTGHQVTCFEALYVRKR